MKITLPNKATWTQANRGDILGELYASWNLDLISNPGKIRVSPKTVPTLIPLDVGVGAVTDTPFAFAESSAEGAPKWYTLCGREIYGLVTGTWTKLGAVGGTNPGTGDVYRSDICDFNNGLVFTLAASISYLKSTWTNSWLSISLLSGAGYGGLQHPVCTAFNNLLLIGNGNNIISVDVSNNVNTSAVVLPNHYWVEWIKTSSTGVWIGAKNVTGGEAKIFFWDGSSANYNYAYPIPSGFSFSGVVGRDGVCYTVNSYGQLLRFNGSAFVEVARLPVANSRKYQLAGSVPITTDGFNPIHRNGMAVVENEILVLVNAGLNAANSKLLENQLSGIWCYSTDNGLYHRYSITKNDGSHEYDYGSPEMNIAGALQTLPKNNGSFYAGASIFANADGSTALNTLSTLDTTDTTQKLGYLITSQLYTQEVQENWQKLAILIKPLINASDYVTIKYRANGLDPLGRTMKKYDDQASQAVMTGTWSSPSIFTVSSVGDLTVGDEVEILSGMGSGLSSSITGISGTYITLNNVVSSPSGTITFRNEGWTKIDTIQDLVTMNKKIPLALNTTWVQFKIILSGKGNSPELDRLISISQPQLPAV